MAAIKVADIFAQIGARFDARNINRFQKRLDGVKRQLISVRRIMKEVGATRVAPITNLSSVRSLNTELARTQRIMRDINRQGPVRVRNSGGGGGGGGASRRSGNGNRGAIGAAAGFGLARNNAFTRQFAGGFGAALVTRQIFNASADAAAIETALSATLRPGQELGEVMGFLRGEASRLGFEFRTSALEFAKLAAAGNAAGIATEDIQSIFISAQEASRVFGLSVADTEGVLKAFTQIISKGKVTAEELRNQLGDRLPAAVPIFAKALGVTTQELSKMLENGEILANDALPKFATELRKTFGSEVPNAANRIDSALNRFKNTLFDLLSGVGEAGGNDFFKIVLDTATVLIRFLTPAVKVLAGVIRILVIPLQAATRILRTFLDLLKNIHPALEAVPGVVTVITAALFAMNTQLARTALGFLRAAAPIILLILLFDEIITALKGGETAAGKFVDKLTSLTDSSNPILMFVGTLAEILETIVQALAKIVGFIKLIIFDGASLKTALSPFTEDIGQGISNITDKIRGALPSTLNPFAAAGRAGAFGGLQSQANITVNAAPGQSPEAIGRAVKDEFDKQRDADLRNADAAFPEVE